MPWYLPVHPTQTPSGDLEGQAGRLIVARREEYRLRYKALAKTAPTADERAEAQARQASFKILINSFYGYLGFSGARFGDGELAAEVTRLGRELLQQLIEAFAAGALLAMVSDTLLPEAFAVEGLYTGSLVTIGFAVSLILSAL